jgi:hypothetical protein
MQKLLLAFRRCKREQQLVGVGISIADERECARVGRLCVAKQMSDDFCSEEPSLSVILRDEFNRAESVHWSRQTRVILHVTMM